MSVLEIRDVVVRLGGRELLAGVNLALAAGESVAIVGPSGSGKTTLLRCILGSCRPVSGSIRVARTEIVGLRRRQLARVRAEKLGMVFQHGELIGELTPLQNVALPALLRGDSREDAEARARELLERFGVACEGVTADVLSGGERQRTALARALMNRPQLILADEPTGSLDPATRETVADELYAAPAMWGCGLLVVTHDDTVARRADHVWGLEGGHLVAVDLAGSTR